MTPLPLENLNDPDPQVRIRSIKELSDHGDAVVLDRLIDLAQHDPNAEARCAAIVGIGDLIGQEVISTYDPETGQGDDDLDGELTGFDLSRVYDFMLQVYCDQERSLDEKRYATEVLGFFSTRTAEETIASLYANPEKEAKLSALFAMGRNGSVRWTEILREAVGNPDLELQVAAIDVIGELGLDTLGKDLWRLTYAEDKDVVLAALWALGQTGWDGAFERLDELTLHDDPEIREAADEALDEWLLYNELTSEFGPDMDTELL